MKAWKVWRLLGLGVCCCLLAALLAGGVLHSSALAVAQPGGQYQIAGASMSGGVYRLTTANWQVGGTAGGGDYRLVATEGRAARRSAGSGCCCTYLPCILTRP